jgi:sulfotransferase
LVFDTNRQWTAKAPALAAIFPKAKIVCCVRNPAWVLDSLERLTRRNALEPSRIFNFDPGGTVYARAEALMGGAGMIGFAHNALREAVWGDWPERLLLVRFETLTGDPAAALGAIYDFIGEPSFAHDPTNLDQDFDALEFDARLGAPGLHTVKSSVRAISRRTILPPDLFRKYETEAFWERKTELPNTVRMV